MKKTVKKLILIALVFLMCIGSSMCVCAEGAYPEENLQARYIKDIAKTVSKLYKFGVTEEELYEAAVDYVMNENPELLEGAIRSMLGSLDKYSGYLDSQEVESFGNYIDRNYVGIGITITREIDYLEVTEVTPGGPAEAAGFLPGDKILSIDGEDARKFNIDMAAERVRGEEGTSVTITVLRGDEELTYTVIRAVVSVASSAYTIIDDIGYIKIVSFNHTTVDEVKKAFAEFDVAGIKKIIADVRDNPGGELQSVLKVLYKIIPDRMPITTIDYNGDERDLVFNSGADFKKTDRRYAVLVNKSTASAAELFAGAIRDNGLGTVIGEKTFGKGSVQEFLWLASLGGLNLGDIKLTVAEYVLPGGEKVHGKGITPDIKIKNKYVPLVNEEFLPIKFEAKYRVGDSGDGVKAIEQRLSGLGYQVGEIDGFFDEALELATYTFQADMDLFPYGVMDITTQTHLDNAANEAEVLNDLQLEAAFDYFKKKAVK